MRSRVNPAGLGWLLYIAHSYSYEIYQQRDGIHAYVAAAALAVRLYYDVTLAQLDI